MRRTGRILTLKGRVEQNPIDSLVNSGYELTTIFNDDRQGYGWKIIGVDQWTMPAPRISPAPVGKQFSYAVMTVTPDDFENAVAFGLTIFNTEENNNAFVASSVINQGGYINNVIDSNHVIVNQLGLLYLEDESPSYIIYLEEYEISDNEEITFKIKEKSQDYDLVE